MNKNKEPEQQQIQLPQRGTWANIWTHLISYLPGAANENSSPVTPKIENPNSDDFRTKVDKVPDLELKKPIMEKISGVGAEEFNWYSDHVPQFVKIKTDHNEFTAITCNLLNQARKANDENSSPNNSWNIEETAEEFKYRREEQRKKINASMSSCDIILLQEAEGLDLTNLPDEWAVKRPADSKEGKAKNCIILYKSAKFTEVISEKLPENDHALLIALNTEEEGKNEKFLVASAHFVQNKPTKEEVEHQMTETGKNGYHTIIGGGFNRRPNGLGVYCLVDDSEYSTSFGGYPTQGGISKPRKIDGFLARDPKGQRLNYTPLESGACNIEDGNFVVSRVIPKPKGESVLLESITETVTQTTSTLPKAVTNENFASAVKYLKNKEFKSTSSDTVLEKGGCKITLDKDNASVGSVHSQVNEENLEAALTSFLILNYGDNWENDVTAIKPLVITVSGKHIEETEEAYSKIIQKLALKEKVKVNKDASEKTQGLRHENKKLLDLFNLPANLAALTESTGDTNTKTKAPVGKGLGSTDEEGKIVSPTNGSCLYWSLTWFLVNHVDPYKGEEVADFIKKLPGLLLDYIDSKDCHEDITEIYNNEDGALEKEKIKKTLTIAKEKLGESESISEEDWPGHDIIALAARCFKINTKTFFADDTLPQYAPYDNPYLHTLQLFYNGVHYQPMDTMNNHKNTETPTLKLQT